MPQHLLVPCLRPSFACQLPSVASRRSTRKCGCCSANKGLLPRHAVVGVMSTWTHCTELQSTTAASRGVCLSVYQTFLARQKWLWAAATSGSRCCFRSGRSRCKGGDWQGLANTCNVAPKRPGAPGGMVTFLRQFPPSSCPTGWSAWEHIRRHSV